MPRFFIASENISDGRAVITGSDARHIALALRMAVDDMLTVSDFSGMTHECRLESITPSRVSTVIISSKKADTEPPYNAVLYQALPKGDKMDVIVQKAVECGVSRIVPFISERCISKPDEAAALKRLERWRRIAREAAMQCGRGIVPEISEIVAFNDICKGEGMKLMCYEGEGTITLNAALERLNPADYDGIISFVIGAEGGFSSAEVDIAHRSGYITVGLGPRILRCETAAAFTLACLSFKFEQTRERGNNPL